MIGGEVDGGMDGSAQQYAFSERHRARRVREVTLDSGRQPLASQDSRIHLVDSRQTIEP